jgi:hypothetical protein
VHFVSCCFDQRHPGLERSRHACVRQVRRRRPIGWLQRRRRHSGERFHRRLGDVLVLLGAVCAGDANRADHTAVHGHGHAALERQQFRVGDERHAPVLDGLLEHPCIALELRRGAGLCDGDVRRCREGAIEPLEVEEVAAIVHDRDGASGLRLLRFGSRGGCQGLRAVE